MVKQTCTERMLDEAAGSRLRSCDACKREMRSSSEWVCSDHRVICDTCYQNLLNPDKKITFEH